MKAGIGDIVGRTISEVIVGGNSADGKEYVFLVFSDGNYFEIYGRDVNCAGGLDRGGAADASRYLESTGARIDSVYRAS